MLHNRHQLGLRYCSLHIGLQRAVHCALPGQRQQLSLSTRGPSFDELRNHLGSTVLVTDRSGNAFETQQYHAYGRPRGGGALPTDSVLAALQIRAILLA